MLDMKARLYKALISDTEWYPENSEFRLWADEDWHEFNAAIRAYNVHPKVDQSVLVEVIPRLTSVDLRVWVRKNRITFYSYSLDFDPENNREVLNFICYLRSTVMEGIFDYKGIRDFEYDKKDECFTSAFPLIPESQDRWDYLKVKAGTSVEDAMKHLDRLTGLHMEYKSHIVSWGENQYGDEQIEEVMGASIENPNNNRKIHYRYNIYKPYNYNGPHVRGYGFDFYENGEKFPYEVKNENNKPYIATLGAWLMGF